MKYLFSRRIVFIATILQTMLVCCNKETSLIPQERLSNVEQDKNGNTFTFLEVGNEFHYHTTWTYHNHSGGPYSEVSSQDASIKKSEVNDYYVIRGSIPVIGASSLYTKSNFIGNSINDTIFKIGSDTAHIQGKMFTVEQSSTKLFGENLTTYILTHRGGGVADTNSKILEISPKYGVIRAVETYDTFIFKHEVVFRYKLTETSGIN